MGGRGGKKLKEKSKQQKGRKRKQKVKSKRDENRPRTPAPEALSRAEQVRPLHDRLIVQLIEESEQQVGGIIIPDTAKEKPQRGKVIAAGKGKVNGSIQPLDVKAGDTVLCGKYSGTEIKLDGEDYMIMREDEILGVIETDK